MFHNTKTCSSAFENHKRCSLTIHSLFQEMDMHCEIMKDKCEHYQIPTNSLSPSYIAMLKLRIKMNLFLFSPIQTVLNQNSPTGYDIHLTLIDELVIKTLTTFLTIELGRSDTFSPSCYSQYDTNLNERIPNYMQTNYCDYLETLSKWRDLHSIIRIDCGECVHLFRKKFKVYNKFCTILDDSF